MIVMQRAEQDRCPLCRDSMIMQADSGEYYSAACRVEANLMIANLDLALMNFLQKFFSHEVQIQTEGKRAESRSRSIW